MNWIFPLIEWHLNQLPDSSEPGSFGFVRKHDIHTGVDLYCLGQNLVKAVETGFVVAVEEYTGPKAGSPWWLPTKSILIEGESGVVCYGEVMPIGVSKGDMILKGQIIAYVVPVLRKKSNLNIANHSNHMLHFELYTHGTRESVWWKLNEPKPTNLLDPTEKLNESYQIYCAQTK
jgi:murein DD-endopeptidase MepM/ murein hydrolase activator NlpD